jgi:CheY-like chemotaxis protein
MTGPTERSPERVVLVADDEEIVRRMTARILHDAGFRVLEARDGAEAVTLLATLGSNVLLVVSDIRMPGMTGEELAEKMAVQWPAIPILLISGQGVPSADFRGVFLPKPFLPDTLVAAVRALLSSMGIAAGDQESAPGASPARAHWWDHPRLPVA